MSSTSLNGVPANLRGGGGGSDGGTCCGVCILVLSLFVFHIALLNMSNV